MQQVAPLQTALSAYDTWVQKESGFQLCTEELCTKIQKAIKEDQSGFLLPQQEHRLMQLVNRVMNPVNALFNRQFTAGISPLLCADVLGEQDGKFLLFKRDGKQLAMFGGIADKGETLKNTAIRECFEESGFGCRFVDVKPAIVRDTTLGGPIPRISVVYRGNIEGSPVANHEAKEFVWLTQEEIHALDDKQCFASHASMMKSAFNEQPNHYMSSTKELTQEKKAQIRSKVDLLASLKPSQVVERAIDVVAWSFAAIEQSFLQYREELLKTVENFERSRDILWPESGKESTDQIKVQYQKEHNWNDFDRLWDLIKPWQGRLLSTNPADNSDRLFSINKIFNTKIKIREAGVVELISFLKDTEGRYVVKLTENGFQFPSVIQRYDESFPEALYRGMYQLLNAEIADGSKLFDLGEEMFFNGHEQDDLSNDKRTFIFTSQLAPNSQPRDVTFYTLEELMGSFETGLWDSNHREYGQFLLYT